MVNLLDNAVKYSDPGPPSRSTCRRRGQVVLAVHDPGIGIPGRDLDRIFERFYRVDRARVARPAAPGSASRSCVTSRPTTAVR